MSVNTMSAAERKLRNQRSVVVQSEPFFGTLLLRQEPIETTEVETMATDGDHLYFNPEWVLGQGVNELRFTCAHEALHPGLCHHTRRGDRDFELWNYACDYAINPVLVEAGFDPPLCRKCRGASPAKSSCEVCDGSGYSILLRDDLRGMSAEQIYAKLVDERRSDARSDENDSESDGEKGSEGCSSPGASGSPGGADGAQDSDGQKDADGEAGADGKASGKRKPNRPDFGGTGCVLDAAKTNAEIAAKEAEWKVAIADAMNRAETAGRVPGSLVRAVGELLSPRADWRDLLRRFMDQFARADYSWRSPNRRFVSQGTYLPSLQSEALPPIAFVVDASGSMSATALTQALSEVESIVSELRPERLDVVVHDTEVRYVRSFEPDEPVGDFRVTAGGGTSFVPVGDWLNDQAEEYACVIWFTDLQPCDTWDEIAKHAPNAPTIWVDYGASAVEPSFGDEVVRMEAA